nr:thymidylate synthase [Actinopolyspora halophila]
MWAHAPLAPASFPRFHDAYVVVLKDLASSPQHQITTQGRSGPERLNVSFQLADPTARMPLLTTYRPTVVTHLAEALWLLSGRNDVAMMRHYAPRLASYSVDGLTIPGAGYGARLFRSGPHATGRTAFDTALGLIRADPGTRRAVLPILGAHEVGDVSCTIAFQLVHRDGALHGICYTRAKDASRGLVSDVYSFTFIQELAARLLGVQLGTYTHHVGSMHITDDRQSRVGALLDEATAGEPPPFRWPHMPSDTTLEMIDEVCAHEQRLRANLAVHTSQSLAHTGLPRYWQSMIALLEIYRQVTYEPDEHVIDSELVEMLDPAHRWLVRHAWPSRMPPLECPGVAS